MMIFERLQSVFRDVFDDKGIILFEEMTAKDIEDWDSLMNINLIVAIEEEFRVSFTTDEILDAKNVGDFIRLLESKSR